MTLELEERQDQQERNDRRIVDPTQQGDDIGDQIDGRRPVEQRHDSGEDGVPRSAAPRLNGLVVHMKIDWQGADRVT